MISDLVQAYLDKFADYKDAVLQSITNKIPTSITTNLPRVRNILKSSMLNSLFDTIYINNIVTYSILDSKLKEMYAKHLDAKTKINNIKEQLDNIETYVKTKISLYNYTIPIFFSVMNKVVKTDSYFLQPLTQTYVTHDDVLRNADGTPAITTTITPWSDVIYKLPDSEDEAKVLLGTGVGSLHFERTIYTDTPLSFINDGVIYNGTLVTIKIPFRSSIPMNRFRIDFVPNHYNVLYIKAYYLDGLSQSYTYLATDTVTRKYIDIETELINATAIEIAVNIPFPTIETGKTSTNIEELKEFIAGLSYSIRSFDTFKTYLSKTIGSMYSTYKYKYMCGIYSIKIQHNTYNTLGVLKSSMITPPSKENSKTFIRLSVTQDVDADESIAYILHTDVSDKLITPYKVNGIPITAYTIHNTTYTDAIDSANSTATITNDTKTCTFSAIEEYINLDDFLLTETLNVSASAGYAQLISTPVAILSVKYGDVEFTPASTIDELSENDNSSGSSPKYYLFGNLMLFNKLFTIGLITITYQRGPQWLRLLAILSTTDTSHTPILTSADFEVITTPRQKAYIDTEKFIDRSKELS